MPTLGNDTINGFQIGVDGIELSDLLDIFLIDDAVALSGGFIFLTKIGVDTLVQFDQDGTAGSAPPLTLAAVTNASVTAGDRLLDGHAII